MIAREPQAIIDIGSNSVRLVVYAGPARAPATLFNEKVMAGLGRGLGNGGALDPDARRAAMRALERFRYLIDAMEVPRVRAVATAAVRDASDGAAFIAEARDLGLKIELLTGEEEGRAAGLGVISGIPDADGIVGDMGGGSLELARVGDGRVHQRVSLPLGGLRAAELYAQKPRYADFAKAVRKQIAASGFTAEDGLPLYMVGGSWRALARIHIAATRWPLPVLHQYTVAASEVEALVQQVAQMERRDLRALGITVQRMATLAPAAALLRVLVDHFGLSRLVTSASGLREGLLYADLDPITRARDPLIVEAANVGARYGRFAEHGELIDRWIAPLFDDAPALARLRLAACLLGDVAWSANPELRAERGLDIVLHGDWRALDAEGRALVSQALFTSFGGAGRPEVLRRLAGDALLDRAEEWGLAMRLGQRLSGGVARPLKRSRLSRDATALRLHVGNGEAVYGEAVEKRHRALAQRLGLTAMVDAAA